MFACAGYELIVSLDINCDDDATELFYSSLRHHDAGGQLLAQLLDNKNIEIQLCKHLRMFSPRLLCKCLGMCLCLRMNWYMKSI